MPISEAGISTAETRVDNKVTAAMLVLISSLMVSSFIFHFLRDGYFVEQLSSDWGIILFIGLTVIPYTVTYYLFRKFISPINRSLSAASSTSSYFRLAYSLLKIALLSNAVIQVIIIFQVATISAFSLGLTILSLQPNAVLVSILFSYLGYKFVSWFRSSRDLTMIFIGISFLLVAVATVISDAANTLIFLLEDPWRMESQNMLSNSGSDSEVASSNLKADPRMRDIFLTIQFPLRIAFVFYWIATVMLLRKYSKSIGKLMFWTLVSSPLATFVVASIFIYGGIGSPLIRGVMSSTFGLVAGVLFGLIFLTIARRLGKSGNKDSDPKAIVHGQNAKSNMIFNFLMMSVFGIILFLVTSIPPNHIIDWVHVPYPPFADVIWSFLGFGAYLYSFGLFYSTISISQDTRLRKSIHKLAMQEADMLNSLGSAQMKQEIQKKVAKLSKEHEEMLREQTGVEQKFGEEEMKHYVDEVMQEVKRRHNP